MVLILSIRLNLFVVIKMTTIKKKISNSILK